MIPSRSTALALVATFLFAIAVAGVLVAVPRYRAAIMTDISRRASVLARRTGWSKKSAAAMVIASATHPTSPTASRRTKPWVSPASVGKPYGDKVKGLLTFRGNPTRTYYGEGPVPSAPHIIWRYPDRPMCAVSRDLGVDYTWCGTGWTGQPAVFERKGRTWVVFGAFDKGIHFLDAATGRPLRPPFYTGDIIKGSVTIDPDGYPIVYSGSRDNYFRAIAFDGPKPRELWRLSASVAQPIMWNDDWDGSALVLDDYLFVGGENSRMHIAKLNRGYDKDGRVTVRPKLIFTTPGWDKPLLAGIGDSNVSIENSVAIHGNNLFFSNSGGLAQIWSIAGLKKGVEPRRTFRLWTGDDTDASIVVDRAGSFYIAAEWERGTKRAAQLGQILKINPFAKRGKSPVAWGIKDRIGHKSGAWATPALYKDVIIAATHAGRLMAIDRNTSEIRWELARGDKTWPSPVVVEGKLIQGDCSGTLTAHDIADTKAEPKPIWSMSLGGCIESTPAVWKGRIFVGARDGYMYGLGDDGR